MSPAVATAYRRTPTMNGPAVARDVLVNGLSVDGSIVAAEGQDIIRTRVGLRTLMVIRHPDYVDHVLHDGADAYNKSIEYELLRSVLGLNLFTDEAESWRRHRMILNPVMAKRHVKDMCELMYAPIEAFVGELGETHSRAEVEMAGEMTALTLDVVGAALFGHKFGELAREMKHVVTDGLRGAEIATRLLMVADPPVWAIRAAASAIHRAPWLPPPLDRMQWVMRTVDKAVWDLINDRRANPSSEGDVLNLLLAARDEEGKLSLRRVRNEVTTFMLAGHETTANAMAWMWYLLALNTDVRDRMLEEIDTVLGGRRPTVADLEKLPWTTACFHESMRYMPPAWAIPRTAIRKDVIDGHPVPKGATVIIPAHAIHHDERFWPEPERFDPSRFLPENSKGRHRSSYLPFGGGRRICIGTSFALLEATLITTLMSQRFTFDLVPGHPVEPEATLTLRPRHGVKMIVRPRTATPQAVAA